MDLHKTILYNLFQVRRCDIVDVEVTASEIDDAVKELSRPDIVPKQEDTWFLPLCEFLTLNFKL